MHCSCGVEIRNEEGWSLYGLGETCRAETHKHADYHHYELRICQWISARMCSFSQPDNNCQTLQVIAPSACLKMSGVISQVGWGSVPVYHLWICLLRRWFRFWLKLFMCGRQVFLAIKFHPFHLWFAWKWISCKVAEHRRSTSIFMVVNWMRDPSWSLKIFLLGHVTVSHEKKRGLHIQHRLKVCLTSKINYWS